MTLTLDFQGQIFDSHILGMGRSIGLEWKRYELDTMVPSGNKPLPKPMLTQTYVTMWHC